jgi:hypothetical protein
MRPAIFNSLGSFLAASAAIGFVAPKLRVPAPRYAGQTAEQKQIALDRAEAKRARKAAKLRRDHERDH